MLTLVVGRWSGEAINAPTVLGAILDEGERSMHARAGVWRQGGEESEMAPVAGMTRSGAPTREPAH